MSECLVAFSGGKDSFLAVCRLASQGYTVRMISFDNGSELVIDNILHGVKRLLCRFGADVIKWEGFYPIYGIISELSEYWKQTPLKELAIEYPSLTGCQATCLHCQSAMWVAGVAYCKAKGIPGYATGYKKTDEFCTGADEWVSAQRSFANKNGVTALTPMWDGLSDFDRDTEMLHFHFHPSVLECKCVLGCWPQITLQGAGIKDMMSYFDDHLLPLMVKLVPEITHILSIIRLDKSVEESSEARYFRQLRERIEVYTGE